MANMTTNGQRPAEPAGPPTFELGEFIHTMLFLAAIEHVGFDDDDEDAYNKAHEQAWEVKLTKLQLALLAAEAVDDMGRLHCIWCGVDTGEIGEFYMVNHDVWAQFGPAHGCLCVGCLEKQMGRRLRPGDFQDIPINTMVDKRRSDRLRDRLGTT